MTTTTQSLRDLFTESEGGIIIEFVTESGEKIIYGASHSTNDDWCRLADGRVIRDWDYLQDEYLSDSDSDRLIDAQHDALHHDQQLEREMELREAEAETAYMHSGMHAQWYGNVR